MVYTRPHSKRIKCATNQIEDAIGILITIEELNCSAHMTAEIFRVGQALNLRKDLFFFAFLGFERIKKC